MLGKIQKYIIISRRKPDRIPRSDISSWADNIKYSRLNLDNKLNFTHHIKLISQQAIGILIIFYPLLNRSSNLSLRNNMLISKLIVLPTLKRISPLTQTNHRRFKIQFKNDR